MHVEASDVGFKLDGYTNENEATDAATTLRNQRGYATQYNEPITLSVIIVSAAITAIFDTLVPKVVSWRAERARKVEHKQDKAREEQFERAVMQELQNQTKVLLELASALGDRREAEKTSAAAVAKVLDTAEIGQVVLSPETTSETELIAEIERFSGGRIQGRET